MKAVVRIVAGSVLFFAAERVSADQNLFDALAGLAQAAVSVNSDGWNEAALFHAGDWTVQTYGSAIIGDDDHGTMYAAHLGVGYFFLDNISINLDLLGGVADTGSVSGDDDGIVGGFDLLLRWHWLRRDRVSLYLDGGCGFQLADTDFPSDSHHNFRPQLGVGATYELRDGLHLIGGVRYVHISNARTTDGNDGLDGAMLYAGLMWGF